MMSMNVVDPFFLHMFVDAFIGDEIGNDPNVARTSFISVLQSSLDTVSSSKTRDAVADIIIELKQGPQVLENFRKKYKEFGESLSGTPEFDKQETLFDMTTVDGFKTPFYLQTGYRSRHGGGHSTGVYIDFPKQRIRYINSGSGVYWHKQLDPNKHPTISLQIANQMARVVSELSWSRKEDKHNFKSFSFEQMAKKIFLMEEENMAENVDDLYRIVGYDLVKADEPQDTRFPFQHIQTSRSMTWRTTYSAT